MLETGVSNTMMLLHQHLGVHCARVVHVTVIVKVGTLPAVTRLQTLMTAQANNASALPGGGLFTQHTPAYGPFGKAETIATVCTEFDNQTGKHLYPGQDCAAQPA